MEERLQYILSSVNDWLKFGESKNAALLAANVAIAFGLLSQFQSKQTLPILITICTCVVLGIFILASAICMASFMPKLRIPEKTKTAKVTPNDSLIFYGHVSTFNPHDYLVALYNRTGLNSDSISTMEEDYARQIIVNSGIALWKYQCFRVALIITMVAVIGAVIDLVLLLFITQH